MMTIEKIIILTLFIHTTAFAKNAPTTKNKGEGFMTTVQLEVEEPTVELMDRSVGLIKDEFKNNFRAWPVLHKRRYEVRRVGNQIIFSMITDEDLRYPMQNVVSTMIEQLNGKVRARGRTQFYKAALTEPTNGYLEVRRGEEPRTIESIDAEAVTLRDLLRELKSQFGFFSYAITTKCADRAIDWNFKAPPDSGGKSLDVAMAELAAVFDLNFTMKLNNYYIFEGNCQHLPKPKLRPRLEPIGNLTFYPPNQITAPHKRIFFPIVPMRR